MPISHPRGLPLRPCCAQRGAQWRQSTCSLLPPRCCLLCRETEYGTLRGDKRSGMPPAALQSWRERLGACYGFDVRTPAQTHPKKVLIVDRPYEAGWLAVYV